MKITKKFLTENDACSPGMKWVTDNKLIGLNHDKFIDSLMNANKFNWANWLIVRCMTHLKKTQYAIFAAEQVISIYEARYPKDLRPRKAIEAAKEYLNNPTDKNKDTAAAAAAAAADATYDAAHAYDAAYDAAAAHAAAHAHAAAAHAAAAADAAYAAYDAAYDAAHAAAHAAAAAAYDAAAAADAAHAAAADAAADDAADARKEMQAIIINYGLTLIDK
jgi:hypothetical protein